MGLIYKEYFQSEIEIEVIEGIRVGTSFILKNEINSLRQNTTISNNDTTISNLYTQTYGRRNTFVYSIR